MEMPDCMYGGGHHNARYRDHRHSGGCRMSFHRGLVVSPGPCLAWWLLVLLLYLRLPRLLLPLLLSLQLLLLLLSVAPG